MDEPSLESSPDHEYADAGWLVLSYDESPVVRLDLRCAARLLVDDGTLTIAVGDRSMSLGLDGGPAKAQQLLLQLAPYTRSGPITDHEQYVEAQRMLAEVLGGNAPRFAVLVDDSPVRLWEQYIAIGDVAFLRSEVESYALEGHYLPLPNGPVRAAVVMFAVHAMENPLDADAVKRRILEYETASGGRTGPR